MQYRPRAQTLPGFLSTVCGLVFGLTLTLLAATAVAQAPSVGARSAEASAPAATEAPSASIVFDEPRSPRIGQWLAIGYDNGLWGNGFAQGVRFDIPLADHFALRLRSLLVNTPQFRSPADPVIDSGAELIGRSSVLVRLLRLYGGGGLWLGARPNPTAEGKKVQLAGGGFLGMEAFASPKLSLTLEVGGQGAGHGLKNDAGASVMGGLLYYFGR
jgi:hypothetical protein